MPRYFNIFECDGNLLKIIDMMYERACMATPKDNFFEKMLETIVDHNNRRNAPFLNENIQQAVSKVMAETEDEERNSNNVTMEESNANSVTMDTLCQSPVTTNIQRNNANFPNERRISSVILAERIKMI